MSDDKNTAEAFDRELDATGLLCPEPVMMLHQAINDVNVGEIVHVIATDPSTERDITNFCHFLGHELLRFSNEQDKFLYWIKKSN
jgi:tRNA 2-thiouridine synthesizing protein A